MFNGLCFSIESWNLKLFAKRQTFKKGASGFQFLPNFFNLFPGPAWFHRQLCCLVHCPDSNPCNGLIRDCTTTNTGMKKSSYHNTTLNRGGFLNCTAGSGAFSDRGCLLFLGVLRLGPYQDGSAWEM